MLFISIFSCFHPHSFKLQIAAGWKEGEDPWMIA
ncbi:unnamed protein product [Victoria cruziana]